MRGPRHSSDGYFPRGSGREKDLEGSEAHHENGLAQRAIKALKSQAIDISVMADVALDPFTSHGQDGVIDDNGYVQNDITVDILVSRPSPRPKRASILLRRPI